MVIFLGYSRMDGEKTFQGVPVAPGKRSNRERNFNPGYTGQKDKYGLDVPSNDVNDYYNPSGTYNLMEGGDNTLRPYLKTLKNAALAKYAKERAVAENNKRKMNNIKRRHPGLIRNLGPNFAAAAGKDAASAPSENAFAPKALTFRKSRKGKSRRQRRQKKTRRQRK